MCLVQGLRLLLCRNLFHPAGFSILPGGATSCLVLALWSVGVLDGIVLGATLVLSALLWPLSFTDGLSYPLSHIELCSSRSWGLSCWPRFHLHQAKACIESTVRYGSWQTPTVKLYKLPYSVEIGCINCMLWCCWCSIWEGVWHGNKQFPRDSTRRREIVVILCITSRQRFHRTRS